MLAKFWFYILPPVLIVGQFISERLLARPTLEFMYSELGLYENLQFLVLVGAVLVALATFVRMDRRADLLMTAWVAIATLCCIYVAGEEISWGQHFIGWGTPGFWTHLNDQNETNLHNTSAWLDQKPRLILMIGVAVGGLIIPLLRKIRPAALPERFNAFYPSSSLWVVAALAIGVHLLDKVVEGAGINLFERTSEMQELCFYYFVLLYLLGLRGRLVPKKA